MDSHRVYLDTEGPVMSTYRRNHETQTLAFVQKKLAEYLGQDSSDRGKMTLWQIMNHLEQIHDDSDPDTDLPQSQHSLQTAERLREMHPDKDWLHLVGLIHDFGKLLLLFGESQEHTVGDTFPVGCEHDSRIVYHNLFKGNPDSGKYDKNGIYEPNCGFDNVLMSWGHDEYWARTLEKHETCTLPPEAIYVIRYHSFYAWHQEGAYDHLASRTDRDNISLLQTFQKADLYSKTTKKISICSVKPYYDGLMKKYGLKNLIAL